MILDFGLSEKLWKANLVTQPQNPENHYALGEEIMDQYKTLRQNHSIDPIVLQNLLKESVAHYQKV